VTSRFPSAEIAAIVPAILVEQNAVLYGSQEARSTSTTTNTLSSIEKTTSNCSSQRLATSTSDETKIAWIVVESNIDTKHGEIDNSQICDIEFGTYDARKWQNPPGDQHDNTKSLVVYSMH